MKAHRLKAWLSHQKMYPKVYWNDGNRELAALGNILCFEKAPRFAEECQDDMRFYGGMHFPCLKKEVIWDAFPRSAFWLPAFEIIQTPSATELIVHSINGSNADLSLHDLIEQPYQRKIVASPSIFKRLDLLSLAEWKQQIAHIQNSMKQHRIQKVVLARSTQLEFHSPPCVWQMMEKLEKKADRSTLFAFQPRIHCTFFGASPEKLFQRKQSHLWIDALAGTRTRGISQEEDLLLEKDLIHHPKDAAEFNMVKDFIGTIAHRFAQEPCAWFERDTILKTAHVQHIYNRATMLLKQGISDHELIEYLHPTPAVGGFPKEQALQLISECESFQRGWYAAPIGWIAPKESDLTVAIRSGLIRDTTLRLFGGAGIVAESSAESEWEEINHKMRLLLYGCGVTE